jgi:phosphate transport system protein
VLSFDAELEALKRRIAEMEGMAENMLTEATDALVNRKVDLAQKIIAAGSRLNGMQQNIGHDAVVLIARRQPVAVDLRETVGAIRIASDLARVGDLAMGIARRAIKIAKTDQFDRPLAGLNAMYYLAATQLKDVMLSYATRDAQRAKAIWERDIELDTLEDVVLRELITFMMEDQRTITLCTQLLFCAKCFERIGDHATNIAEAVIYIASGEEMPVERPHGPGSTAF